ncbi:MAG: NMD3-related protein [Candidatus Asgardarchaeia archaeon]
MPQIFCPICGKKVISPNQLINGVCANCFLNKIKLFVEPNAIKFCNYCGAVFLSGKWVRKYDSFDKLVSNYIISFYKKHLSKLELDAEVNIVPHGLKRVSKAKFAYIATLEIFNFKNPALAKMKQVSEIKLPIELTTCDRCQKIFTGQFEAILQVRKFGEPLSPNDIMIIKDEVNKVIRYKFSDPSAFISDIKEKKTFIEFKVGSNSIAKAIANHFKRFFNAKIVFTAKLVSLKEGKRIYRVTAKIDLPIFSKRDVVIVDDKYIGLVHSITNKYILIKDLIEKRTIKVYVNELYRVRRVNNDEIQRYQVISISPKIVQIMDLESYDIYEIDNSNIFANIKVGDVVKGIIFNNRIVILP